MTTVNNQGSIVWSKGDKCMSPYSGDLDLYKGVIQKIRRSPAGQVLALVKFDDYGEDDSEEVNIKNLQKVKETVKAASLKRKAENSPAQGGMFSPLQGSEFSQRLKVKYESDSEDEELSTRREKLTSVLFGKKTSTSGFQTSRSGGKSRKTVVAIGGEPIKGSSRANTRPGKGKSAEPESPSPTTSKRKGQLDISGGQARDVQKELITSKRLSDISSIVDSHVVKKALQRQADGTGYSSDDDDTSGFTEEDLEKPKFTFKPEGAKVPLVLSGAGESTPVQVPGTLNQYLRDYQRDGIKFLYSHYIKNRGAILGDDMGLGKTVQVIGFLSALLGKQGNRVDVMRQKPKFIRKLSDSASIRNDAPSKGPFLIIGPGCVLYNWLEELDTWGYFTVRKYHGIDKIECLKDIRKGKVEIVVTTFETFREHLGDMNSIDWAAVIVDEVHKIKDMKARTTKALRNIITSRRYGLTGTALQNNLLEFWSILDWAQPGCLGCQGDYVHEFVHPIETGQRHDANKRELATARKQKSKLAVIRKSMMIRRLKSLIADQLPKKDDSVVFCKLSQLQVSIYQTILDQPGMDLVIHADDPCNCDSGEPQSKCCKRKSAGGASVKSLMFTFMHLLLKTSNHVALLIPTRKTSEKQAKMARVICEAALKEHPEFVVQTMEASFKTLSDPKYCGKMKILQGLLKVFYKEHSKALVFSYSTQVLDIIEQHLMSTGYEYRRIDGSVSPKKRMLVVREFNTDPNIFLCIISTKAGGLGLNLTGANKVVIFDPNWNPTHDLQAQDRAYRIGQRRNVQVYRLVSSGTIEENMYLRQIYKQQLLNVTVEDENAKRYFYAVQGNPKQKGELFGVKNMFVLRTGGSCITRDIIKRNERVESALAGLETAQYIPPVVRVDDDEEYGDIVGEADSSADSTKDSVESESEDLFAHFFTPADDRKDDSVETDNGSSYSEEENTFHDVKSSRKGGNSYKSKEANVEVCVSDIASDDGVDNTTAVRKTTSSKEPQTSKSKHRPKVTFQEPPKGKVKTTESRKGKCPMKRSKKNDDDDDDKDKDGGLQYDQTLAGTFADVSDVFDNCEVVHIHENVKVVGGSRAEDHMSKCAIADVYELQQNSQDLAAQCEPMSEPSDDEFPQPVKKGGRRGLPVEDHNTERSTVIGNTKFLIGQTPNAFRLKHIEEMCQHHKAGSLLEFAELVLSSGVSERIRLLNNFYETRNAALKDVHKLKNSVSELRHAEESYSKRKYEREKLKYTQKRSTPSRLRFRSSIGQSIAFLDNAEPDSESVSQPSIRSDTPQSDVDSMEVGRNISHRKRVVSSPKKRLIKKCKVEGRMKHEPVASAYVYSENDYVEEENDRNIDTERGPKCEDAEDLLDEIGNHSEENVTNLPAGARIGHKIQELKRNKMKASTVSNVLDDMFFDIEETVKQVKKLPPTKNYTKSSLVKKVTMKKRDVSPDTDDPFKAVDEIFGSSYSRKDMFKAGNKKIRVSDKTKNSLKSIDVLFDNDTSDAEVNLDASTLKDDNYDCFDNPKLWKKKKRKEPDKRNLVDRLIEDSDADFNDLFTSGKLKKNIAKQDELNNIQNSESRGLLDGSASLFS